MPTGSRDGGVKFLSPSTGKIITRNDWIPLPMPKEVIKHLNDTAKKLGGTAIVPTDLGEENEDSDEEDEMALNEDPTSANVTMIGTRSVRETESDSVL